MEIALSLRSVYGLLGQALMARARLRLVCGHIYNPTGTAGYWDVVLLPLTSESVAF